MGLDILKVVERNTVLVSQKVSSGVFIFLDKKMLFLYTKYYVKCTNTVPQCSVSVKRIAVKVYYSCTATFSLHMKNSFVYIQKTVNAENNGFCFHFFIAF